MIWVLAGGGAFLLVVVVAVVVLFLAPGLIFLSTAEPTSPTSTPGTGTQPPTATSRSAPEPTGSASAPTEGTIEDERAGLAYARLGGTWSVEDDPATGWTAGQETIVQRNYDGPGGHYVANILSGPLPSSIPYTDSGSLKTAAERYVDDLEPRFYPSHQEQRSDSRAMTVGGNDAWVVRKQLFFPQSSTNGWNFDKEWLAVVVVDGAAGDRPGAFVVSIPNSHETQGDFTKVLDSLDTL